MATYESIVARRVADRYVSRIRNPAKRAYAIDYERHLIAGAAMAPSSSYNLGGMARQAVEMRLREILGGTD